MFDPYFNPIDVSAQVKVDATQSLYSVYDALKNHSQKNDSESDEKSEIVVCVVFSDHVSSDASFIVGKENSVRQCQDDNEDSDSDNVIHSTPEYMLMSSLNKPNMKTSCRKSCMSSTNCTSFNGESMWHCQKMLNVSSLAYTINHSSGYPTENEVSAICNRLILQPMLMEEKRLESSSELDIEPHLPYMNRQVDMYNPQLSNTTMFRQFSQTHTYCEKCIIDNQSNLPVTIATQGCSSANKTADRETYYAQHNLTSEELAECKLSLNPLHFEQMDSYI